MYRAEMPDSSIMYLRSRQGFDAATVGEVVYKGIYERNFSLGRGQTVMDVGAHIGSFTIMAAKKVGPGGIVVSLEPSSRNYKMLGVNIKANHYGNVRPLNMAAGSTPGVARLNLYRRPGGNSFHERGDFDRVGVEEVKVTTLDGIADELKLGRVDFIKIDVEGHELEVLKGASRILGAFHPNIVMETHDFGPSIVGLTEHLKRFDYSVTAVPYGNRLGLMYASLPPQSTGPDSQAQSSLRPGRWVP